MTDIDDLRAAFPALEWSERRGGIIGTAGEYRVWVSGHPHYASLQKMTSLRGWMSISGDLLDDCDTPVAAVQALLDSIVAPALALGWAPQPAEPEGPTLPHTIDVAILPIPEPAPEIVVQGEVTSQESHHE